MQACGLRGLEHSGVNEQKSAPTTMGYAKKAKVLLPSLEEYEQKIVQLPYISPLFRLSSPLEFYIQAIIKKENYDLKRLFCRFSQRSCLRL